MHYRSILIHVTNDADLERRIALAAKLAAREHLTVIGLAITGISRFMSRVQEISDSTEKQESPHPPASSEELRRRQHLRIDMTAALERFSLLAQRYGIASIQQLQIDDDAASALSAHGNAADLIILGRSELKRTARREENDFVEFVTLNSAPPVLTINDKPFEWRHALIAWNSSSAAARATRNALPLLQEVDTISAVIFGSGSAPDNRLPVSEEDLRQCLSPLAKPVDIIHRPATADVGHALLALAEELNADLIVMGCVAHPRWRDTLLGGTTGVVIAESQVSLLLSR